MLQSKKPKSELVRSLAAAPAYGEPHDPDQIAGMLKHGEPDVVAAALDALAGMGEEGAWYMDEVVRQLGSNSKAVRSSAASALGAFGSASLQYTDKLVQGLADEAEEVRVACIVALGNVGVHSEVQRIADLVSDRSPAIAAAACQALGLMGTPGESHAGLIAKKIDDAQTRYAALIALANLGSRAHVTDIEKCLTDEDSATRQTAAAALGSLADAVEPDAAQRIATLLGHDEVGVRCAAALALGYLGEKATSYADKVADLLDDTAEDTSEMHLHIGGGNPRSPPTARHPKCAALVALGMLGSETHAGACAKCLGDDNYEVRLCALECMSHMGSSGRARSNDIAACLEDSTYFVRMKACECIGILKAEDVMTSLPELFEDKAPSVKIAALNALAECPQVAESFSNEVVKCVSDPVPLVKAAAVSLIGALGTTGRCYASVVASLLVPGPSEEPPLVRAAACEALGRMGEYGAAFADDVALCLETDSASVRASAEKALELMSSVEETRCLENAYIGGGECE